MINYTVRCHRNHEFEGWFKDAGSFETQRDQKEIECPICGSRKVDRSLSAPNVSSSRQQQSAVAEQARAMRNTLKKLRNHVESTHENVGEQFANEARKIHYGETEIRNIYGQATSQDARELTEEGISILPLPWVEKTREN